MSLKPSFCVRREVPVTVSKQSATNASELLESATICIHLQENALSSKIALHIQEACCRIEITKWLPNPSCYDSSVDL